MAKEFYKVKPADCLMLLKSESGGISEKEAEKRLQAYGPNIIDSKKRRSGLRLLSEQFMSFLVIILIAAAAVSFALGEAADGIAIFSIVILNAFLGFFQENKAENSLEALKKMAAPTVKVLRHGQTVEEQSERLVPGDVILLEAGDGVPADCRALESKSLRADESLLTGESEPVDKNTKEMSKEAGVADRKNMLFSGTSVVYGRCKALVCYTGMQTEFGKIASELQQNEEETPLQRRLNRLGKQLGMLIIAVSAVVFVSGLSLGMNAMQIFLTSVALAVAAIPEGLPAIVTITLASGLQTMAKKNAIVRRLSAVEALGSTTIICADKTGTLTLNKMSVRKVYANGRFFDFDDGSFLYNGRVADAGQLETLLMTGLLCNDAGDVSGRGDPTEIALIKSARAAGLEAEGKRTDELPFESERKMMSVIQLANGKRVQHTKGAPEEIAGRCTLIEENGKRRRMTEADKRKIMSANGKMASSALRVLAFAYKPLNGREKIREDRMIFLGLQGMIDPPRPEAAESIMKCKSAGIRVAMITGDNPKTAKAIAGEIGIDNSVVITGEEMDRMSDERLEEAVSKTFVYARVTPSNKYRIVQALRKKGHIIAMTGDGINDAPALKSADIGIAVGSGTDVSKEASDMVLADDNFASIVSAVEEGRGIYDNIKKFIMYLLASNTGEVITVFAAIMIAAFGGFALVLPLLPLQILWMNLLTDGLPALALGFEQKERDIMKRKPRKEDVLTRKTIQLMFSIGIAMASITLALFYATGSQTVAFTTLVLLQLVFAVSMRSAEPIHKIGALGNKKLLAAVLASLALQLAVIYIPQLATVFETAPLSAIEWAYIAGACAAGFAIFEGRKIIGDHKAK